MSPGPTQRCGTTAEELAAGYLETQGVIILARNLRCRRGEIDLVALEGELLLIIEVRCRRHPDFGGALASVTPAKRRRLIFATRFHWQREPQWHGRPLRFDVIAVEGAPERGARIEWIKDAFRAAT